VRRAAKVDANQPETIAHLRSLGWHVQPLHTLGQGVPDLLCSKRMNGIPWSCLCELKVSGGKLTPDQQKYAEEYLGPLVVAYGPEDAASKLNHAFHYGWVTFGRGMD
jgi:hypothetical protein